MCEGTVTSAQAFTDPAGAVSAAMNAAKRQACVANAKPGFAATFATALSKHNTSGNERVHLPSGR